MARDSNSLSSNFGYPNFSLARYPHFFRVFWLRRDTTSESPVLTSMEATIDLSIYTDKLKVFNRDKVPVDRALQVCIISKAVVVNRLDVEYNPIQKRSIKDATSTVHSLIGNVELQWHKKDSCKTQIHTFYVVDSTSEWVRMGMNAVPKPSESDVDTLGLQNQTDEEKAQQEKKRQEEQAKRAKEKEAQAQKEKNKQTSSSSGK